MGMCNSNVGMFYNNNGTIHKQTDTLTMHKQILIDMLKKCKTDEERLDLLHQVERQAEKSKKHFDELIMIVNMSTHQSK